MALERIVNNCCESIVRFTVMTNCTFHTISFWYNYLASRLSLVYCGPA